MLRQKQIKNYVYDTEANFQAALPMVEGELSFVEETRTWHHQRSATENVTLNIQGTFPVVNILDFTTNEPAAPVQGDLYINNITGTSSVTSQAVNEDSIYEWNGTSWIEIIPFHGMFVYNLATESLYGFDNTTWFELGGGSQVEYVITIAARDALTNLAVGDRVFVKQNAILYQWNGTMFNIVDTTIASPFVYSVIDTGLTTSDLTLLENGSDYEILISNAATPPQTFTIDAPGLNTFNYTELTFFVSFTGGFTPAGDYTFTFASNYKTYDGSQDFGSVTLTSDGGYGLYKFSFFRQDFGDNLWRLVTRTDTGPISTARTLASFEYIYNGGPLYVVSNGTTTRVPLNVPQLNIIENITHDDTNDTLVIVEDGVYRIDYRASINQNAGWSGVIRVRVNGSEVSAFRLDGSAGVNTNNGSGTLIQNLTSGDILELEIQSLNSDLPVIGYHFNLEKV